MSTGPQYLISRLDNICFPERFQYGMLFNCQMQSVRTSKTILGIKHGIYSILGDI